MTSVFGAGNWGYDYYASADPTALFSSSTSFIYMEGGAGTDTALNAFLGANATSLQNWVSAGGRLIIESAGWNVSVNTPFGVDLAFAGDYSYASGTGTAVNPGHPIFNGPFAPVGTSWSGGYFSHDILQGSGYTALITGTAGDVLGAMRYGSGLVLFSGITTDNFHSPSPEAANLTANMISYAAVPEPATLGIVGAGLIVLGLVRRRAN